MLLFKLGFLICHVLVEIRVDNSTREWTTFCYQWHLYDMDAWCRSYLYGALVTTLEGQFFSVWERHFLTIGDKYLPTTPSYLINIFGISLCKKRDQSIHTTKRKYSVWVFISMHKIIYSVINYR